MQKKQSDYEAEQEYNKFQGIIYTVEVLTKEEYNFVVGYDPNEKSNFTELTDGKYLNLGLYTEREEDEAQYSKEQ